MISTVNRFYYFTVSAFALLLSQEYYYKRTVLKIEI